MGFSLWLHFRFTFLDLPVLDPSCHQIDDLQVFIGREVKIEIWFLDNPTDTGEDNAPVPMKILSKNFNRARGGHQECQNHSVLLRVFPEMSNVISPFSFLSPI